LKRRAILVSSLRNDSVQILVALGETPAAASLNRYAIGTAFQDAQRASAAATSRSCGSLAIPTATASPRTN